MQASKQQLIVMPSFGTEVSVACCGKFLSGIACHGRGFATPCFNTTLLVENFADINKPVSELLAYLAVNSTHAWEHKNPLQRTVTSPLWYKLSKKSYLIRNYLANNLSAQHFYTGPSMEQGFGFN